MPERDLSLRAAIREMLEDEYPEGGHPTFAAVGELLGLSKQRVWELAKEMGIGGRVRGRLRGRRRWSVRPQRGNRISSKEERS
jgi:hypothetical protein